MKFTVIIIIIIMLGVLFAANYFFYFSLVKFFAVSHLVTKKLLFIAALFLSASFILASIFAQVSAWSGIRWYYAVASTWMGFLFYAMIGFGAVYLISFLGAKTGIKLSESVLAAAALVLAGGIVTYGYFNDQQVRLKRYTLEISGLPAAWRGKTIANVSDLHLGIIHGAAYAAKTVKEINQAAPDIVFLVGDYFDGSSPDYEGLAAPLKDLAAPLGAWFVTGNHETYAHQDEALAALDHAGVRNIKDEVVEIEGVQVAGVNYPERGINRDLAPVLAKLDPARTSILLYHEPRYLDLAKTQGVNLQLAGHTHRGQLWPISLITRLIYGKYYYGLHQEGDYAICTTSGAGSWGPPIRVGTRSEIALIELN